jgi:hypothetical protein
LRRLASVLLIAILTTLVAQPSYSDDVTINLDSNTPYVDIPVTITEPVDATISTITGTPQTNPGFIDSWIEVWQGLNKLRADDDGNYSANNWLASIIRMPLTAGEYFIRATSFAYMCCNAYPTGTYLLSTNLTVAIPSPTPSQISPTPTVSPEPTPSESVTPSPSPTPTQTSSSPTPEPTPEPSFPSPSPSDIPQPSESPEVPVVPSQEPNVPDPEPFEEFSEPSPLPSLDVQDTLEEVVDSSFNDFPSSLENDLPSLDEEVLEPVDLPLEDVSSIDEILSLLSFLPEISLENLQEAFQQISETITAAFESIPGGEQVLAAAEFVGEQFTAAAEFATNLGTEFTPEERKEAQQVVLGAVIVTQLSTATRRIK